MIISGLFCMKADGSAYASDKRIQGEDQPHKKIQRKNEKAENSN
jgi:hypothetical protein